MKFVNYGQSLLARQVAPFVGAWIEIAEQAKLVVKDDVAPFVGAWIEIREKETGT